MAYLIQLEKSHGLGNISCEEEFTKILMLHKIFIISNLEDLNAGMFSQILILEVNYVVGKSNSMENI